MSRLWSFSLRALFRPFEPARRRKARFPGEEAERAAQDEPERLERSAAYARAGYFNMGYTHDGEYILHSAI